MMPDERRLFDLVKRKAWWSRRRPTPRRSTRPASRTSSRRTTSTSPGPRSRRRPPERGAAAWSCRASRQRASLPDGPGAGGGRPARRPAAHLPDRHALRARRPRARRRRPVARCAAPRAAPTAKPLPLIAADGAQAAQPRARLARGGDRAAPHALLAGSAHPGAARGAAVPGGRHLRHRHRRPARSGAPPSPAQLAAGAGPLISTSANRTGKPAPLLSRRPWRRWARRPSSRSTPGRAGRSPRPSSTSPRAGLVRAGSRVARSRWARHFDRRLALEPTDEERPILISRVTPERHPPTENALLVGVATGPRPARAPKPPWRSWRAGAQRRRGRGGSGHPGAAAPRSGHAHREGKVARSRAWPRRRRRQPGRSSTTS